jgi:hypothetical protein
MVARKMPVPARLKNKITALEADLAYFDAVVTYAGQIPETIYQRAQIRIFKALAEGVARELEQTKEEARERAKKLTL